MRTTDKNKSIFEGKSNYRNRTLFSNFDRNATINEHQNFVVPWQMSKKEERKFVVK